MMTEEEYMQVALEEARKGWGSTLSNPMVGAVIVENGRIASRGYHASFGGPHAEVEALNNLGRRPVKNAILYVTLEPCSSTGKTGPCTTAIIESGIRKVVVGAIDPDQRHRGQGIEILKETGIETTAGVLAGECEDLNLIFNFNATVGKSFFAAKTATTLDGKISTRSGSSQWITGEAARKDVMRWRRLFPAIAVGSGTVLADDPSLTSRLDDSTECGVRFVFDRRLRTLAKVDSLKVYNDSFKGQTVVVTVEGADEVASLEGKGITVWQLPSDSEEFWTSFKERCTQESMTAVYFEGGPGLLSDLLAKKQLDYLFAYRAPKFLADDDAPSFLGGQEIQQMSNAYSLENVRHATFGDDQLSRGFIQYS